MSNFHAFKIGNYQCVALKDKEQQIPLTKQFPQVSEYDLKEAIAACGLTEMTPTVGFNLLYVDTGFHKVLIDSGYPDQELGASLVAAGISPEDINALIITHGDGDHIGGIANFSNAQVYMPEKAYQLWTTNEGQKQMIDEFEQVFKHILPADMLPKVLASRLKYGTVVLPKLRNRINTIDPRRPIFPGVRMVEAFGHRSDHYAVEIESTGEVLLHIVDAFRHPIQVLQPTWYSFLDSYPESFPKLAVVIHGLLPLC